MHRVRSEDILTTLWGKRSACQWSAWELSNHDNIVTLYLFQTSWHIGLQFKSYFIFFIILLCWRFSCCRARCGWMMQIQTQWEECFTPRVHSSVELCTVRVQSQKSKNSPSRFACHGTLDHISWWMTMDTRAPSPPSHPPRAPYTYVCVCQGLHFSPW